MITERNASNLYYNQVLFCSETRYNKNKCRVAEMQSDILILGYEGLGGGVLIIHLKKKILKTTKA